MPYLSIQIVRFVSKDQPGVVAAEFTDALGQQHTIVDKVPVIAPHLWSDSTYPQPGEAACEVLEGSRDAQKRDVVRITIAEPWNLESLDGETEFLVFASQITNQPTG